MYESERERIDRLAAAWQPTAAERAWENIGWAPTLTEALEAGRKARRPVFLFTLDGRMGVGRC